MVDTENKSKSAIADVISNFEATIESLKAQLADIDEEYRKKCDEAKKELIFYLQTAEGHLAFWKNLEENETFIPGTSKRTRKPRAKKNTVEQLPEDERVIDEQANESAAAETSETDYTPDDTVSESADEASFTESSSENADVLLFSDTPVAEESTKEEETEEVEESEESEEKAEEIVPEDKDIIDESEEEWPEFPEEW